MAMDICTMINCLVKL